MKNGEAKKEGAKKEEEKDAKELTDETREQIRCARRYLHKSVVDPLKDQVPRMVKYFLLTETHQGESMLFTSLSTKFDDWLSEAITSKTPTEQDDILGEYMPDDEDTAAKMAEDDGQLIAMQDSVKVIKRVLENAHR